MAKVAWSRLCSSGDCSFIGYLQILLVSSGLALERPKVPSGVGWNPQSKNEFPVMLVASLFCHRPKFPNDRFRGGDPQVGCSAPRPTPTWAVASGRSKRSRFATPTSSVSTRQKLAISRPKGRFHASSLCWLYEERVLTGRRRDNRLASVFPFCPTSENLR